jgi:hypothetical protein
MIRLTILVDDISNVLSIFTHVRLYTSSAEDGTYTHLSYVALSTGRSTYYYDHTGGTEDTWYRSSYYNMGSGLESSLSDAVQGVSAELYHYPTYPNEVDFSSSEQDIIRKIRRLIGDLKGLDRLYISSSEDEFCSSVHDDNKTVEFGDKGWPVYISLNEIEKTSTSDPVMQGYKWATFSGTIGDDDYPIDIWYYTFKFSDREVYQAYGDTMIPPGLDSDTVTQDHLVLQSAIDLLENMWGEDSVEDGADVQDDRASYSPSPGLLERSKILDNLKRQLSALVKQYMFRSIRGVLID